MNQEKRTSYIIYGLIIILILFGVYVQFGDNKFINKSQAYQYANGDSVFDVRLISDNEAEIKVFLGDDPIPRIISTRYDPARLEDVKVEPHGLKSMMDDNHVFFTVNPEANMTGKSVIAIMELGKIISNSHLYNIPSNGAVTTSNGDSQVITCETGASQFQTVIELRFGEENRVFSPSVGCIIIEGEDEDGLIKGADRLIMHWLGIMQ